jgi:hypothetical protein
MPTCYWLGDSDVRAVVAGAPAHPAAAVHHQFLPVGLHLPRQVSQIQK